MALKLLCWLYLNKMGIRISYERRSNGKVWLGVNRNDSLSDAQFLAKKLLSIKLFEDTEGSHWRKSVKDLDYELLCVSQFTLHARTNKGN